jgi:hypothetical protein
MSVSWISPWSICYAVARRSCARDADHGSKRMHWPPGPYDGRRPKVRCVRRPPLDHTAAFRHMCRTPSVRWRTHSRPLPIGGPAIELREPLSLWNMPINSATACLESGVFTPVRVSALQSVTTCDRRRRAGLARNHSVALWSCGWLLCALHCSNEVLTPGSPPRDGLHGLREGDV